MRYSIVAVAAFAVGTMARAVPATPGSTTPVIELPPSTPGSTTSSGPSNSQSQSQSQTGAAAGNIGGQNGASGSITGGSSTAGSQASGPGASTSANTNSGSVATSNGSGAGSTTSGSTSGSTNGGRPNGSGPNGSGPNGSGPSTSQPDHTYDQYNQQSGYDYYNKQGRTYSSDTSYTNQYGSYVDHDTDADYKYYPCPQKAYEDNMDAHHYGPVPTGYNAQYSTHEKLQFPANICADKPCEINYTPKGNYGTKIYVYATNDYSKPYETVCDDCGHESYSKWKPSKDCIPSDHQNGSTYRFKICNKDDETKYTWSCEFPIWNNDYYNTHNDKPVEGSCPPPVQPPACPVEGKAPVYPTTPAASPAATSTESAPASCDTCEAAAPAGTEASSAEAPAAPYGANATSAESPEATYQSGAGALRASLSVIAAVAAFVTFAL